MVNLPGNLHFSIEFTKEPILEGGFDKIAHVNIPDLPGPFNLRFEFSHISAPFDASLFLGAQSDWSIRVAAQ